MPIYEYECQKCNTTFEMIQPISAKPLKKHGENGCNGKVQRLVGSGKKGETTDRIQNMFFDIIRGGNSKFNKWLTEV